jgi:choline kinase
MAEAPDVTQTVILAAGSGSRLASSRGDVPKPLMTVGGVPLIAHALEHARVSGCTEAIIVIGYEGARVQAAIEQMTLPLEIKFVQSPDHTAPNGISLLAAEPLAAAAFYLQMVDHLFGEPMLPLLAARPFTNGEAGRLLVDSMPSKDIDLADATKVQLIDGRVSAIGKGLREWHAIDAGCFALTPRVFDALRQVPAAEGRTVSSGMRRLAALGQLGAVDMRGGSWVDVDTPADRSIAERLLERRQLASGLR